MTHDAATLAKVRLPARAGNDPAADPSVGRLRRANAAVDGQRVRAGEVTILLDADVDAGVEDSGMGDGDNLERDKTVRGILLDRGIMMDRDFTVHYRAKIKRTISRCRRD